MFGVVRVYRSFPKFDYRIVGKKRRTLVQENRFPYERCHPTPAGLGRYPEDVNISWRSEALAEMLSKTWQERGGIAAT